MDLENLALATGAAGARDLAELLPAKVAKDINRYVAEQAWARRLFVVNRDLVGATGLGIHYPLKEKSVAMRVSEMGELLAGHCLGRLARGAGTGAAAPYGLSFGTTPAMHPQFEHRSMTTLPASGLCQTQSLNTLF